MEFGLSEDQRMLVDTLERYLSQRYATVKPHDSMNAVAASITDHWHALAELGIIGALFTEDVGGFGGRGGDIAAVFEQFGRALVVEPFMSAMMAGHILARAGGNAGLVEAIISGTSVVMVAHEEPQMPVNIDGFRTRAKSVDGTWFLDGTKAVVAGLEGASHVLVSATIPGATGESVATGLFLVEAGTLGQSLRLYPTIDGGSAGELILAKTPATLVTPDGAELLAEAQCAGVLALCWEAVGIMDILKAATVDYLRTRKQFGVPIGKFQTLQHRLANVALEIEQARSAAINAASAFDGRGPERDKAAAAAKHTIGRVGNLVAEEAIQMHGGIGMTWELPLSHYAKRLIMIDHQLGDEDHHLSRYASLAFAP